MVTQCGGGGMIVEKWVAVCFITFTFIYLYIYVILIWNPRKLYIKAYFVENNKLK